MAAPFFIACHACRGNQALLAGPLDFRSFFLQNLSDYLGQFVGEQRLHGKLPDACLPGLIRHQGMAETGEQDDRHIRADGNQFAAVMLSEIFLPEGEAGRPFTAEV